MKPLSWLAGLRCHLLQAVPTAPCRQRCPPGVFPRRAQVAPVSPGKALPKPRDVPVGRACQWPGWLVATDPSTVPQQWTCEGLGQTGEGKGTMGKEVAEPNITGGRLGGRFQCQSHGAARPRQSPASHTPQHEAMGEARSCGAGASHHHHARSSHVQPPVPRRDGKSDGESEARQGEPCPAPGHRRPLTLPGVEGRGRVRVGQGQAAEAAGSVGTGMGTG